MSDLAIKYEYIHKDMKLSRKKSTTIEFPDQIKFYLKQYEIHIV